MENKKSSFTGLIPLLIFVIIYLGTGIFLQSQGVEMAFYQLPSPVAIFVGIIVAFIMFKGTINEKFNSFLEGCGHQDIITMCIIYLLPGAFEIPLVAKRMAESGKYDAIITLGAVIKGSTPHFDYVCAEVSKGVATVSLNSNIPVIFGVLTTNSIEEAIERAGTKAGNKGFDAAVTALEMVNLLKGM